MLDRSAPAPPSPKTDLNVALMSSHPHAGRLQRLGPVGLRKRMREGAGGVVGGQATG